MWAVPAAGETYSVIAARWSTGLHMKEGTYVQKLLDSPVGSSCDALPRNIPAWMLKDL